MKSVNKRKSVISSVLVAVKYTLRVHVPDFWGCLGRRTGVAVTAVSNSLILGGWVTKVFKNGDKK